MRAPGRQKIFARAKVLSILTLGRNRFFQGNLPKSGGERPKNPGRRVSGRECQRGVE